MSSAMFGRMFATGAYYICLQYASEIFPTSIRGSGLSLCEIIGGIGLFMSPWIVYLVSIDNMIKIVLVFLDDSLILMFSIPHHISLLPGEIPNGTSSPCLWSN